MPLTTTDRFTRSPSSPASGNSLPKMRQGQEASPGRWPRTLPRAR
ncbi:unnamed protein product [Gulo gulo]|uniref:Uncharacterized protein n=1 Tax=Gulo gulo TaxID=48420 RepID=A0A9X9LGM2_GULGU|nr:unnamed protein product [Gulo gulo]